MQKEEKLQTNHETSGRPGNAQLSTLMVRRFGFSLLIGQHVTIVVVATSHVAMRRQKRWRHVTSMLTTSQLIWQKSVHFQVCAFTLYSHESQTTSHTHSMVSIASFPMGDSKMRRRTGRRKPNCLQVGLERDLCVSE